MEDMDNGPFFALIRRGLANTEEEFGYELTDVQWKAVMDMGYRQSLFGVMMDGIGSLKPEQRLPRELMMRGLQTLMRIENANRMLNRRVRETVERFEKEGFHVCLLKGQGLAALYPNPMHRMPGDIDLWVTDGRKRVTDFLRKHYGPVEAVYHHVDCPMWEDVEVEVHTTPSWMNCPLTNGRLQRMFDGWKAQTVRVEIPDEGKVPVPSDEMNRVYVLLHVYRHLFQEGIGLRQLADYCMVLKKGMTDEERMRMTEQLERLHMTRFARAVMFVMERVFGLERELMPLEPSEKYGNRLLDEVMRAGNFGRYDERIDYRKNETEWGRFCQRISRGGRFVTDYPRETLWMTPFKLWHYVWRKRNN